MEEIRVRYFSKFGHTKKIAEYIAEEVKCEAKEICNEDLTLPCNLLFIGGAPYANIMDNKLKKYLLSLNKDIVNSVAIFGTSIFSKRAIKGIKKILRKKEIKVYDSYLHVPTMNIDNAKDKTINFVKDILKLILK